MSKVVTRTDEAFVLWTLQTSKDSWIQNLDADGKDAQAGKSKSGGEDEPDDDDEKGHNRFGSESGMELYQQIIEKVHKTRDSIFCEDWDRQLQGHFRDKFKTPSQPVEKKGRSQKKRKYEKNFDMLVDDF